MVRQTLFYFIALLALLNQQISLQAQTCATCTQAPGNFGPPTLTFTSPTTSCTVQANGTTLSSILSTPSCIPGGTLTAISVGTGQILIIDMEIGNEERVAISPTGAIIHAGDAQAAWVVQTNCDYAGNINLSGNGIMRICNGVLFHHFGNISYTQSSSFDFCGCAEYIQNGTFTCESGDTGGLHVECNNVSANTTVAVNQHGPSHASVGTTGYTFLETFGTQNVLACTQDVIINPACNIDPLSPSSINCTGNNEVQFNLNATGTNTSGTYIISVFDNQSNPIMVVPSKGTFGTQQTFTLPSGSSDGTRSYIVNIEDSTSVACNTSTIIPSVAPCSFLPIALKEFKLQKKDCSIDLFWETLAEEQVDRFDVFRSVKTKRKFEKIGYVKAYGNSKQGAKYYYSDDASDGNYMYKIKVVDLDGTYSFTPTRSTKINCTQAQKIKVYPNPATDNINVEISSNNDDFLHLDIYDITGRRILETTYVIGSGTSSLQIPVKRLVSGSYILRIEGETFIDQSFRITKR